MRNSVLEELRVRRLADIQEVSSYCRKCSHMFLWDTVYLAAILSGARVSAVTANMAIFLPADDMAQNKIQYGSRSHNEFASMQCSIDILVTEARCLTHTNFVQNGRHLAKLTFLKFVVYFSDRSGLRSR